MPGKAGFDHFGGDIFPIRRVNPDHRSSVTITLCLHDDAHRFVGYQIGKILPRFLTEGLCSLGGIDTVYPETNLFVVTGQTGESITIRNTHYPDAVIIL